VWGKAEALSLTLPDFWAMVKSKNKNREQVQEEQVKVARRRRSGFHMAKTPKT